MRNKETMKKKYVSPEITSEKIDDQVLFHCLLDSEQGGQCQEDFVFHLFSYP